MSSTTDTLNIAPLRRGTSVPMAEVEAANHPEAAAAARARIEALVNEHPLLEPTALPTAAPADLITDKVKLSEQMTAAAPAAARTGLPSMARPLLTAVGIFLLILLVFKSPILLSELRYTFHKQPTTSAVVTAPSVIPSDPTISIPKINVNAPVVYEPSMAEADIQKALESGVVHYGNTALPGQNGNVVIFGHSSNDWWEPGNYKFVFVLLDKLTVGDQFTVDYQSKRYTYQVTGAQVVEPTDLAVLNQTSTPTLTLITCSPPGTSLKRLVVTAKQIDPDPSGNVAPSPTPQVEGDTTLPGSAPGFFTQVGNFFKGIGQSISGLFGGASNSSTPTTTATPAGGELPAVK